MRELIPDSAYQEGREVAVTHLQSDFCMIHTLNPLAYKELYTQIEMPHTSVPHIRAIHKYVKTLRTTGSNLYNNKHEFV
jgi:3-hydroxyacyl-CoA dehydrogenase